MTTDTRRRKILEILRAQGFCNVTALAKDLEVSEVTIRNDLSVLEEQNLVARIHGGAVPVTENPRSRSFEERININQNKKRWIARYAAEQVSNNETIILDASTTAYFIADYLKNHQGLTVFTNGIEVAFKMAENPSNRVILTGGVLRVETASLSGRFSENILNGVRASKAFLSCSGWSTALEAMDDDLFEAQLKKDMVNAAEQVIIVADSSKFTRQGVSAFVPLAKIDIVITDDSIELARLNRFRQENTKVSVCGEKMTKLLDSGSRQEGIRIGFANMDDTRPFPQRVRQGLVQAAADYGIELLLTDNCQDGPTALANIEYFIEQKVDLVVEYNTDVRYGNVIMERLRSLSIPVIAVDIPLPGASFMGVDNYRSGLLGGRLTGRYIQQEWQGQLDKVLSLELPLSGPVPAARMQGQLDGLREMIKIADEDVISMDSQNTYEAAFEAVSRVIPALKAARHIAILAINDETMLGALAAFEKAGSAERVVGVSQGADVLVRNELARPQTRLIGAVAFFPENYGNILVDMIVNILEGKQTPPAVYTNHLLVLAEKFISRLDLGLLGNETISVKNYTETSRELVQKLQTQKRS